MAQITGADKGLIERLANDIWETTKAGQAVAIHVGEGINHWFHATLTNRAQYLPLMLTGQLGKSAPAATPGRATTRPPSSRARGGPGFLGWVAEDLFAPNLDPKADGKDIQVNKTTKDEEPAYWNHGERPLIVNTPKYGRKCFTGQTHMPTPTKFLWFANVNLFNNAKHAYDMLFVVNPKIDCIIAQDVEMTSSCEYADLVYPANTWMEFQTYEITASCSNPYLLIWKGGIPPVHDSRDDVHILAESAEALAKETGDPLRRLLAFILEDKKDGVKTYIQRLLDGSTTTRGYKVDDILAGKYGEPNVALMLFRTYPRILFWENVHDGLPFWTDTGRLNSYCDIPEAITLARTSSSTARGRRRRRTCPTSSSAPTLVRPDDFGIPRGDALGRADRPQRQAAVGRGGQDEEPAVGAGLPLLPADAEDPAPRPLVVVHGGLAHHHGLELRRPVPPRPAVAGLRRPPAAHEPGGRPELGINDGDYVYDANPRTGRSAAGRRIPRAKVAWLMLRVTYNTSYPRGVVMTKHAVHRHGEDGGGPRGSRGRRPPLKDTGYQANLRYEAQHRVRVTG